MSEFLYVIAVGVPLSALFCLLHALAFRRDLLMGGAPVVAALLLFGLALVGLFG